MTTTEQPTNTSEWQLYRVLQRANLLQYYDTFVAQGGDDVQQLCEAGEEEFLEIMALVGMASKPLHVRRLQKALQEWVANPAAFQGNGNSAILKREPPSQVFSLTTARGESPGASSPWALQPAPQTSTSPLSMVASNRPLDLQPEMSAIQQDDTSTEHASDDTAATFQIQQDATSTEHAPDDTTAMFQIQQDDTSTEHASDDTAATFQKVQQDNTSTEHATDDTAATFQIQQDDTSTEHAPDDTVATFQIQQDAMSTEHAPDDTAALFQIQQNKTSTEHVPDDTASTSQIHQDAMSTEHVPDDTAAIFQLQQDNTSTDHAPDDATSAEHAPDDTAAELFTAIRMERMDEYNTYNFEEELDEINDPTYILDSDSSDTSNTSIEYPELTLKRIGNKRTISDTDEDNIANGSVCQSSKALDSDKDETRPKPSKKRNVSEEAISISSEIVVQDIHEDDQSICQDPDFSEADILKASDNSQIYVRRVLKRYEKVTMQKKTGVRVYNSYHSCYYCGKLVQHVRLHLQKKHNVKEIGNLRAKGDNRHNKKVIEEGRGELLLTRRPAVNFKSSDFGPCPNCNDWMLKSTLKRHQPKCSVKTEERESIRTLHMKSDIMSGRFNVKGSRRLTEEVIAKMISDEITRTAINDYIIICIGESCLKRNIDNKLKRSNFTSERMRLCARLLLELRNGESAKEEEQCPSMWDFLKPAYFDKIAEASLRVAMPSMDDVEDLESPSNAIKIKYDLIRMINIKWAFILKEDIEGTCERECKALKNLLHLFKVEWTEKVTKLARTVLMQRSFAKVSEVPSPEDIQKLNDHVKKELSALSMDNEESYKRAAHLVQTRLLLYNKRRSGEIDGISLKDYANRRVELNDVDRSMLGELSPLEEHLLQSQDLMVVRGKRCRPVPVLIPEDVKEPLQFIADPELRRKVSIKPSNQNLFATSGSGAFRCYDSLKATCKELHLSHPERITSVSLRKYTATLSQATPQQMKKSSSPQPGTCSQPVLLENQINEIAKCAAKLASQMPLFDTKPLNMKKEVNKQIFDLIDLDKDHPDRLELMRKYGAIYRRFDSQRSYGKPMSMHEICVNEASAQLCYHMPSLLTRREDLFPLARQVVKDSGYQYSKGHSRAGDLNAVNPSKRQKLDFLADSGVPGFGVSELDRAEREERLKLISKELSEIATQQEQIVNELDGAKDGQDAERQDVLQSQLEQITNRHLQLLTEQSDLLRKQSYEVYDVDASSDREDSSLGPSGSNSPAQVDRTDSSSQHATLKAVLASGLLPGNLLNNASASMKNTLFDEGMRIAQQYGMCEFANELKTLQGDDDGPSDEQEEFVSSRRGDNRGSENGAHSKKDTKREKRSRSSEHNPTQNSKEGSQQFSTVKNGLGQEVMSHSPLQQEVESQNGV